MSFFHMKPTLKDFLDLLETVAPSLLAESWDNPGLQVGSLSQEISMVFVCLDPTLQAVMSAAEIHAQLMFTHHPLFFTPLSRLEINSFPGEVAAEAIRGGVSIVAAHTNLDMAEGGINHIIADLMGLERVEVLKESENFKDAGLGRIGYLPEPAELSVVTGIVREVLGVPHIRVAGQRDALIHRIAVVGGSGGSLLHLAHEKGADLLLTGDVGHHVALEAISLGTAVMDGGHFHTERAAFMVFANNLERTLRDKGWEIRFHMDRDQTDPVRLDPN